MKKTQIAMLLAILPSTMSYAGQQYYEARSDAMGGTGVASSNREGAAFINPAMLAYQSSQANDVVLMLPALGVDGADKNEMIDKFDELSDSYDALELAIDSMNIGGITQFKDELVDDLAALKDNTAYASVGAGISIALPIQRLPMAIFYKSYLDAIGLADIEQSDIDSIDDIDPINPPSLEDLDSQGIVLAGGMSDLGLAFSLPFTIENVPMALGISPKFQRIDTYHYSVSANNFDSDDFDDARYRTDESGFNLDLGFIIEPTDGLVIGVSGRNLISRDIETIDIANRSFTYQVEPLVTAGMSYNWDSVTLTGEIDLTEQSRFDGLEATQYLRVGAEIRATDWLALRAGYREDLNDVTAGIFSFGTGFALGRVFRLDLTGMYGSDDAYGAVLQTSYHF